MVNGSSGLVVETSERLLTASEFQNLANVPPEVEWFANIENANTRRAYKNDVQEFMRFAGIHQAEEFRLVKRSHLIAWRKQLETRTLEASTVRRKLSAVASLFDYLCECNAVPFNPADAGLCQRSGWDVSRETLAKIESGIRCVTDLELVEISSALKLPLPVLFPPGEQHRFGKKMTQ